MATIVLLMIFGFQTEAPNSDMNFTTEEIKQLYPDVFEVRLTRHGGLKSINIKKLPHKHPLAGLTEVAPDVLRYLVFHTVTLPIWGSGSKLDETMAIGVIQNNDALDACLLPLCHSFLISKGGNISDRQLPPSTNYTMNEITDMGKQFLKPRADSEKGYLCIATPPFKQGAKRDLIAEALCFSALEKLRVEKKRFKALMMDWEDQYRNGLIALDGNQTEAWQYAADRINNHSILVDAIHQEYQRLQHLFTFRIKQM